MPPSLSQRKLYEHLSLSYQPKEIYCRDTERSTISSAISNFLDGKLENSNFIYISGLPGNGKTLLTMSVLEPIKDKILINAASLSSIKEIYSLLYSSLTGKRCSLSNSNLLLDEYFSTFSTARGVRRVVLIDEIDFVQARSPQVLYNLADWFATHSGRFLLVGIANSMNLAESFDKKVRSRLGLIVKVPFHPYTHGQIETIITARLSKLKVFSKDAVEMICKKIANVSGDIRKAVHLARASYEMVERKNKKVSIGDVAKASKEVFGSPQIGFMKYLQKEHQLVLIMMALACKNNGNDVFEKDGLFKL